MRHADNDDERLSAALRISHESDGAAPTFGETLGRRPRRRALSGLSKGLGLLTAIGLGWLALNRGAPPEPDALVSEPVVSEDERDLPLYVETTCLIIAERSAAIDLAASPIRLIDQNDETTSPLLPMWSMNVAERGRSDVH